MLARIRGHGMADEATAASAESVSEALRKTYHDTLPGAPSPDSAGLQLSDGGAAFVTDIRLERGPPDGVRGGPAAFTTHNIEVADWHTYFVAPAGSPAGAAGVWVHNAGPGCEASFALIERIERVQGLQGVAKLTAFLEQTNSPGRRKAVDMALRDVMNEVMKETYTEAAGLPNVPTVQQIRALKESAAHGARLTGKDLDIHHSVPLYLLRRLYQLANPDVPWDEVRAHCTSIADGMPGMLIHRKDHVGIDEEGLASFHNRLIRSDTGKLPTPATNSDGQVPYLRENILDGLQVT
jgi:hypothetical protein